MSAIRPYNIRVAADDQATTVALLLEDHEERLLRVVARELDKNAQSGRSPRLYVERRHAGVRASGGAA